MPRFSSVPRCFAGVCALLTLAPVTELLYSDLESLLIKQKRQFPLPKKLEMAYEAALGVLYFVFPVDRLY